MTRSLEVTRRGNFTFPAKTSGATSSKNFRLSAVGLNFGTFFTQQGHAFQGYREVAAVMVILSPTPVEEECAAAPYPLCLCHYDSYCL